jgi:hypothetical protein
LPEDRDSKSGRGLTDSGATDYDEFTSKLAIVCPRAAVTLTHHLFLFACKLSLGLSAAMALTSAKKVTSGFFRVHLWVVLGLQVLAALSAYSLVAQTPAAMRLVWLATATAVAAYIGSIVWLYERPSVGRAFLIAIVALSVASGLLLLPFMGKSSAASPVVLGLSFVSSGLLLGAVTAAMLLGHWYLNTPTMELAPLRSLLGLLAAAIVLRALVGFVGLSTLVAEKTLAFPDITFLGLRWLSGIIAPAILTKMTWETLKIPNTQSATGILYAGVILVFVGELVAQLLGSQWHLPL